MDKCKDIDFSLLNEEVFTKFRNSLNIVSDKLKTLVKENPNGPSEEEFFHNTIIMTHLTTKEEPLLIVQHEQDAIPGGGSVEKIQKDGKEIPLVRWGVDVGNLITQPLIRTVYDFLFMFSLWERKSKGMGMDDFSSREVSVSMLLNGVVYMNLWTELEEEYKALKGKEAIVDKDIEHPSESLLTWHESISIEMYEALMKQRNQNLN